MAGAVITWRRGRMGRPMALVAVRRVSGTRGIVEMLGINHVLLMMLIAFVRMRGVDNVGGVVGVGGLIAVCV
jgi:hypothetical protein